MPGPAIHHIIAKEIANELKTKLDPSYHPFLDRLSGDFASAFYLGSQGPDFLFFNTKDIDPTLKRLIDMYLDITDFIEDFKAQLLAIIPQELKDAVATLEEVYEDVEARSSTLTEISQLLTEAKNLISLLTATLTAKIEQFILDNVEVFELLKHPIQDGQDFKDWWWFDVLHYRRTGQYAQTLLKNSAPGTIEHAYALGYLTHYAADIVGHPFVNIISGGPYRTHPKRHKLVENHEDVMAFKEYTGGVEFVQSKLGEDYIINGDERHLPGNLNNFVLDSLKKVYFESGNSLYGKEMNNDDLNDAYRLWLMWFRKSTNTLDLPKPEPYSFSAEMEEVWNTFVDNLEDLGGSIADGFSGDGGILGVLKAIGLAIISPFLAAAAAIDAVIGAIATLGAAPIRFMISLAYEELYNSYMNLHQAIVLNGFGFPFNSQLPHYLIKHLYDSGTNDTLGHNASTLYNFFPTRKFKPVGMECECHLIYPMPPLATLELDKTAGAPKSYYGMNLKRYIFGPIKFDRERYEFLKKFIEKTGVDHEVTTNEKYNRLYEMGILDAFGSAIDFGCILYQDFLDGKSLADFNLDADRGIGFKAWRKVAVYADVNNENKPHVAVTTDNNVLNIQTDIIDPSSKIL
ncbi:MAG: hypothetical protein HOO91_19100 [Bacteroidales bacterium]|nr:hypothetical protein [Bacteroidales bacterium]